MDWTDKGTFNNNNRQPMLKDKVELLELEDGADFKLIRMIGPSRRVAHHMLPVFKNDGTPVMNKFKQQVRIPKVCLAYDPVKGKLPDEPEKKCPYCKIDPDPIKVEVHTNVIDRELQSDFNPKKKNKLRSKKESKKREMWGGKWFIADNKSSKGKTPCRYLVVKTSVGNKISDMTALNKKKNKDGKTIVYAPNHVKRGFDMNIKFDNNKSASDKYACVKDERTELTDEELDYLLWDIDIDAPEELKDAKKEAESFAKRMKAGAKKSGDSDEDDDDDDDSSKKKKKKGKNKAEDDDWSADEDEDLEDDDEDEDSDDDDDEDDDEDEEDVKKKKSKKKDKKKDKKKKKSKKDDDDDDDDDESEEDDDEDDEDDEDADEDDEDGDDEDDEDEDDEDEEDDEPVKKKKKGKKSKKEDKKKKSKKSKKKSKDEDDDDDWEDD